MKKTRKLALTAMLCATPLVLTTPAYGQGTGSGDTKIRRVLVISIDGMHSLDLALWVKSHPSGAFAQLVANGMDYTNANTTKPSDSIPSTVGIFTGGTPAVGGMYYDDAYNRAWFPPGSTCLGAPGTIIDLKSAYNLNLDGSPGPSGNTIDPNKVPRQLVNGVCTPV